MMAVDPLYVASGFAVGGLVGMTGVGGGSLMTPLLILLFGIHPALAVGTDLLYAAATKTGGSLVHGFNRTIEWPMVGRLAAGSVPMTALTLFMLYLRAQERDGERGDHHGARRGAAAHRGRPDLPRAAAGALRRRQPRPRAGAAAPSSRSSPARCWACSCRSRRWARARSG